MVPAQEGSRRTSTTAHHSHKISGGQPEGSFCEALFGLSTKTLRGRLVLFSCLRESLTLPLNSSVEFGETAPGKRYREQTVLAGLGDHKRGPHRSQCPCSTRAGKSPPRTSTPTCKLAHASPPPRLRNDPFPTGIPETLTANVFQSLRTDRRSRQPPPKNCSSRPPIATETSTLSISIQKSSSDSLAYPP